MFKFLKVTGDSLLPEYREGDFVLVSKTPSFLGPIREGDIVVFKHPEYGILIKKVSVVYPHSREYFVLGTHGQGADSRLFGNISHQNIIGKVVWHIRRPV